MILPETRKILPALFAGMEHYFDWCSLQERFWADQVKRNRKTTRVNEKLNRWHAENPDASVVNLAQWRIARARRVKA